MPTSQHPTMRCALVGADSLLIECGELLLAKGHEIVAVAASSAKVAHWARSKHLDVVDATVPAVQWEGELARYSFEWLFAITHLAILPDDVLALPTTGAVNFHDGPLPTYAGLNTPAWALLRGEREYGISWHVITSGVDEGDLLKQRRFEIADAETSLSLNTRNFEVAIETFDELVDELASGTAQRTPQDLTAERNVFGRLDRPEGAAVIDWTRTTDEIERTVRALDFGRYANPLGFPKVWTGSDHVLVTEASVAVDDVDDTTDAAPGTVVDTSDDRIVIATADGLLALTGFATITGRPRTAAETAAAWNLTPGTVLPGLDDDARAELGTLDRRMAGAERFYARELSRLEPVEIPWASTPEVGHAPRWTRSPVSVPAAVTDDAGAVVGAFAVLLSRLSGKARFHIALATPATDGHPATRPLPAAAAPLPLDVDADSTLGEALAATSQRLDAATARAPLAAELIARTPELVAIPELVAGRLLPIAVLLDVADPPDGTVAALVRAQQGWEVVVDGGLVADEDTALFVTSFEAVLREAADAPVTPVAQVDLLGAELRRLVLDDWNDTVVDVRADACIHQLFEEQVDRTPDLRAFVFEGSTITYRELDERANQLAWYLIDQGIGPDGLVGVHVNRSIELMVAVLAVQKAGGAYVPLDPAYPADRLAHMIRDSHCRVILTDSSSLPSLPLRDDPAILVVAVDTDADRFAGRPTVRPAVAVTPANLAYCIYTSGSTGMPKGVLIEHRNAVNFFVGMDDRVPHELPATWCAVTSLSFDISVLELLYTITRGFTVVIHLDRVAGGSAAAGRAPTPPSSHSAVPMQFSLFYFSGDEAESTGADKYRLLMEGAKWADEHDFCAVWTPERHFHAFGGLYPQPAVTGAAVAAVTKRVGIRAGSVVMPLSHPIRVAEAWSVVDNLSNGRVGISFASGWQPNDFVLMPQNFATAKQAMFDGMDAVKRLWRGDKVPFPGPTGTDVEVTTLPRPVQPELPTWVTSAGNPETYAQAGRIGANVLTHLLGQSIEQLAPKLDAYRKARAEAGFDPDAGVVTLMLHTFVGDDDDSVRAVVREPLKQYLATSFSLLKEYAWAFPAFARPANATSQDDLADDDFKNLSAEDLDAVLEFAYLRYYETSGLFGTRERCASMVDQLKAIGVGEIACLVDFGVATDTVLDSLPALDKVRVDANRTPAVSAPAEPVVPVPVVTEPAAANGDAADFSIAAQLVRHGVTHFQCTPSMARMLSLDDDSRAALTGVEHVFVGGEAFPVALAQDLKAGSRSGNVTNMYGPTETTIWSTTWPLQGDLDLIPIGTPIANTQIYILDRHRQPVPPGVAGELWIGGDGVVRGYHERPELTAERFVADPFRGAPHRMYLTGDLARWRRQPDGTAIVEFLGRGDHQVKIRGYRIELGEIEAQLGTYPGVRECVVVVREETPGDQQLVGYVAGAADARLDPAAIKARLRQHLPDVMVPGHIAVLDDLPHTPNGKIDRNGLPSLAEVLGQRVRSSAPVEAANDLERHVLAVWQETLGTTDIGVDDNFFDIGGHSLLIVRMHRKLRETVDPAIALTDLYRYPTIRGFTESLSSGDEQAAAVVQSGMDRAARRRAARGRR